MGKKTIVYHARCSSIDGLGPDSLAFSSLSERQRDNFIEKSPNRNWLRPTETVEDLESVAGKTLDKLTPLEKLALNVTLIPMQRISMFEQKDPPADNPIIEKAFKYGNRSGVNFCQWKFDDLERLYNSVVGYHNNSSETARAVAGVETATIWYDEVTDYHCMTMRFWHREVTIRYYRAFTATMDDDRVLCVACPISNMHVIVRQIRQEVVAAMVALEV